MAYTSCTRGYSDNLSMGTPLAPSGVVGREIVASLLKVLGETRECAPGNCLEWKSSVGVRPYTGTHTDVGDWLFECVLGF